MWIKTGSGDAINMDNAIAIKSETSYGQPKGFCNLFLKLIDGTTWPLCYNVTNGEAAQIITKLTDAVDVYGIMVRTEAIKCGLKPKTEN